MRIRRLIHTLGATLGAALAVSSCGSGVNETTITMSQAEVAELFSEIGNGLSGGGINASRSSLPQASLMPPGAMASPTSPEASIDVTVNCGAGGNVHVTGSSSGSESSANFDVKETFNSCKTAHFTVGGSITLKG